MADLTPLLLTTIDRAWSLDMAIKPQLAAMIEASSIVCASDPIDVSLRCILLKRMLWKLSRESPPQSPLIHLFDEWKTDDEFLQRTRCIARVGNTVRSSVFIKHSARLLICAEANLGKPLVDTALVMLPPAEIHGTVIEIRSVVTMQFANSETAAEAYTILTVAWDLSRHNLRQELCRLLYSNTL
jgi:hypothetical protein